MKTKALTRAAVMHVLFKRKRVFDSRHGYGGELLGRGWRTKEMAISSYSGWNIVFNVSIPFDSPLLDIKLSRVQERAELQFRCQAQLAYPPVHSSTNEKLLQDVIAKFPLALPLLPSPWRII